MTGKCLIAALAACFCVAANAGSTGQVRAKNIHFMPNGVVLFWFDGTHQSPPACATIRNRFAINGSTAAGKVQVAGLLSAYSMGRSVVIVGKGNCDAWGDTESVNYFLTVN